MNAGITNIDSYIATKWALVFLYAFFFRGFSILFDFD